MVYPMYVFHLYFSAQFMGLVGNEGQKIIMAFRNRGLKNWNCGPNKEYILLALS